MNPPVKTPGKLKPILIGMIFGSLAYTVYLKFLAVDELTTTGLGWLFFAPQYPVLWICQSSTIAGVIACYVLVALFYGYIFLSLKLARGAATGSFLISAFAFLTFVHWRHDLHEGLGITLSILFWPAATLSYVFDDFSFSYHLVRIAVESLTVGFWYAALISGVRTFFRMLNSAKRTLPPTTSNGQPSYRPALSNQNQARRTYL